MKSKYSLENEFHNTMKMINRKFMLERCKLYKVRHRKNEDTLKTLCARYLYKLNKMKPWEIPDDKYGNAGWINPDRVLEDEAIKLTLARLDDHPIQKKFEESIKDLLKNYIKQAEDIELIQKYKKHIP